MTTTSNIDIFQAITQDNIVIIEQLLKNGTNPNIQNNFNQTPLHLVVYWDDLKMVKLLLEYGADPNIQDNDGWTPLHIACNHDFVIVKLLLEHGANPDIQDIDGYTPLMDLNKHDIIMLLIDYGADYTLIAKNGKTALDYRSGNFIKEYLESKEHQIVLK